MDGNFTKTKKNITFGTVLEIADRRSGRTNNIPAPGVFLLFFMQSEYQSVSQVSKKRKKWDRGVRQSKKKL